MLLAIIPTHNMSLVACKQQVPEKWLRPTWASFRDADFVPKYP